ncbi:hypothetical protein H4P12_00120 [Paracoccus sp. 11-3]|uniref:PhiE125 gp8 family phage protein n=1 Tax=Paracoccus amoyensis TaxID=2760093 RepID=A0A926J4L3_9RHOB|nr:hypothetical protein [Paracoccus amoyensis]MBC9245152.1 hypothetical protein [Paracoccus amoyensis]
MNIQRLNRTDMTSDMLAEAKSLARVMHDDEDADLYRMVNAAALEAEELAQIALLHQTVRVTLDGWPRGSSFALPIAPLLDWSTVQITADDTAFEDFSVITGQRPAIRATGPRPCGVVVIEYQAGFGADGTDLPADLRQAVLDQVVAYFDARGPGDPKAVALSPHFVRIVGRYRRVRA